MKLNFPYARSSRKYKKALVEEPDIEMLEFKRLERNDASSTSQRLLLRCSSKAQEETIYESEAIKDIKGKENGGDIQLDRTYSQYRGCNNPPIIFQKRKEKSARVLITIVLTFLSCHTFRFVMKAYEVTQPSHSTREHYSFCLQQQRYHVPVILYIFLSLQHLLLVVNSSVNFIIYCCVGKRFRKELKLMLSAFCDRLSHITCPSTHPSPQNREDL